MNAAANTWFEASTAFGTLRLCASANVRHATDAALLIDDCEELIAALDEWAGEALAWHWPAATAGEAGRMAPVLVHWRDARHRLICPWAWLRSLPPPPESLAAELHWPAVRALLGVACLRLADDELQRIEPGGAVLLPASMASDWTGRLRSADEAADLRAGVPVRLAAPSTPRLAPGATSPDPVPADDGGGTLCEVRLALAADLPGDRLAGWRDDTLAPAGLDASLWRCDDTGVRARRLADGELIPWGDGWALAIRSVGSDRSDPEATIV